MKALTKIFGGVALFGALATAGGVAQAATEITAAPASNDDATVSVQAATNNNASTFTGSNGKEFKVELAAAYGVPYTPGHPSTGRTYLPGGPNAPRPLTPPPAHRTSFNNDATTFTTSNGTQVKVALTSLSTSFKEGLCGGNNGGYHPGIPNGASQYQPGQRLAPRPTTPPPAPQRLR